jgi:hypothetical protein
MESMLIRLDNGTWLDPWAITSIRSRPATECDCHGRTAPLLVVEHTDGTEEMAFEFFEDAVDAGDKLARTVNLLCEDEEEEVER